MGSNFSGKIGLSGAAQLTPGRWRALIASVSSSNGVRGIEATFEYNGLIINNYGSYPDVYKLSKIDGLYDADIRYTSEVSPSTHGEISYETYYAGKTIVLSGEIRAGNIVKLRNMIANLQSAFASSEELPLIISFPDEIAVFISCKKIAPLDISSDFYSVSPKAKFMLTLRASDPKFYHDELLTTTLTPSISYGHGKSYNKSYNIEYGLDISSGMFESIASTTINNSGIVNTYPLIRFLGECESPAIINFSTGQLVLLNKSISINDYYEYDSKLKTLIGSNGSSSINSLSVAYQDFYLAPGSNLVGFSALSYDNNSCAKVYSRDAWI